MFTLHTIIAGASLPLYVLFGMALVALIAIVPAIRGK